MNRATFSNGVAPTNESVLTELLQLTISSISN